MVELNPVNDVIEEKANYKKTIAEEFEKDVKLLPDERIILKFRSLIKGSGYFSGTDGMAVLTNFRLIVLRHKPIGSDRLLYLPLKILTRVTFEPQKMFGSISRVRIDYSQGLIKLSPISEEAGLSTSFKMGARNAAGGSVDTNEPLTFEFFKELKKLVPANIIDESSFSVLTKNDRL